MTMERKVIKIAVCDDNWCISSDIEQWITEYNKISSDYYTVDIYCDGRKLCNDMRNGVIYDLIFLEIALKNMTGIEVGRYIREQLDDDNSQIAYMSFSTKDVLQLFQVQPMDFLMKPLEEKMVVKTLEKVAKLLKKRGDGTFQYKQGRDWNKVYIKDILYFRGKGREIEMVTKDNRILFYSTMKAIFGQLNEYNFFYAHKSYIVNYFQVMEFFYNRLIMSNQDVINIAQSRRQMVRMIQREHLLKEKV